VEIKEILARKVVSYVIVCPWHSIGEDVYVNQGECKTCCYCLHYRPKQSVQCSYEARVMDMTKERNQPKGDVK
jgi:hypothetical protein